MSLQVQNNEEILAAVEAAGGGYVWNAEVFAVTLMSVLPEEKLAISLTGLEGVQHIAIEASSLRLITLMCLAGIPDLYSLVLNHSTLTDEQAMLLRSVGPEVILVSE